jgi:hypothetical protein
MDQSSSLPNQPETDTPPSIMEPVPPSTQPPAFISPPPAPKSPLLPILLTILITSFILIGGYLGYQYLQKEQPDSSATPLPTQTSVEEDPTADWQTYINTKFEFSIKMPQGWSNFSMNDYSTTPFTNTESSLRLGPKSSTINPPQLLQITIYTAENYQEQEIFSPENCTVSDVLIGIEKIQAVHKICTGMQTSGFITLKTKQWVFIIDNLSSNENDIQLVDQILSTFTFSPADASSNDKQMGFITSIDKNGEQYSMNIDYANMLNGNEAKQQMIADKVCTTIDTCDLPNGYYIANVNPKIRTFPISPSVTIDVSTSHQSISLENVMDKQTITLDQLRTLINAEEYQVPWWITISDGFITHISQQYLP